MKENRLRMNRNILGEAAYIWMSSDLLNGLIIEMTGVPQEVASDVICVFETFEDIICGKEVGSFPELGPLGFGSLMDVLYPKVVVIGSRL